MTSLATTTRLVAVLLTISLVVLAQNGDVKSRERRQRPPPGGRRPDGPPGLGFGGPPGRGPPGGRRPGGRPGGGRPGGGRPGGPPGGGRPGGRPGGGPPGGGHPGGPPGGGSGGRPGQGSGGPPGQGGGTSVTPPDNFVQLALSQAQQDTCNRDGYTCTSNECGTGITSVFEERIEGQFRILITNGVPDHSYDTGAVRPNPNEVCIHNAYMKVPLSPERGSFTASGMGPVGIALSGGFFYNHLSTPNGDLAAVVEVDSFDSCSGHADPQCRYHYHKVPNCLDPSNSCKLVGYMMDGFPVYSFCTIDGVQLRSCYKQVSGDGSHQDHFEYSPDSNCQLDEANGYDFGGSKGYGYVFSENYPFVMRGFMGNSVSKICEVY